MAHPRRGYKFVKGEPKRKEHRRTGGADRDDIRSATARVYPVIAKPNGWHCSFEPEPCKPGKVVLSHDKVRLPPLLRQADDRRTANNRAGDKEMVPLVVKVSSNPTETRSKTW